jgi:hypothetical protein
VLASRQGIGRDRNAGNDENRAAQLAHGVNSGTLE